jgi:hypothetical protein
MSLKNGSSSNRLGKGYMEGDRTISKKSSSGDFCLGLANEFCPFGDRSISKDFPSKYLGFD